MAVDHRAVIIISLWFLLRFAFGDVSSSTTSSAFDSSAGNLSVPHQPFPSSSAYPHGYDKHDRVAIIMTGQLRCSNFSFSSASIKHDDAFNKLMKVVTPQMTVATTIVDRLFRPLARLHGLDVFMYLTAHPMFADMPWDSRPETYQPKLSDTKGCEIFSNNEIFRGTGNRFFCLIEPEVELLTEMMSHMQHWKCYCYYPDKLRMEQALQQVYHMYKANTACRQYALSSGVTYKYKLRHRPDVAVYSDFPNPNIFDFYNVRNNHRLNHTATVYYFGHRRYEAGNYDTAGIGLAEHMDIYFDRYNFFLTFDYHGPDKKYRNHGAKYNMEEVLELWLDRHQISNHDHPDIEMMVIRVAKHDYLNSPPPAQYQYQWKDLSVDYNGVPWRNISYHQDSMMMSSSGQEEAVVIIGQKQRNEDAIERAKHLQQQQHRQHGPSRPQQQQQQRHHEISPKQQLERAVIITTSSQHSQQQPHQTLRVNNNNNNAGHKKS